MRWRMPDPPAPYSKRERVRFALLPTQMSDGTWIWLERYRARQTYERFGEDRDYVWITEIRSTL